MEQKYKDFIDTNYPDFKSSIRACTGAVSDMVFRFPELTVQVGFCYGKQHCWLVDGLGSIIDPTYRQFEIEEDEPEYHLIADRFLTKDEYEASTGALFLGL